MPWILGLILAIVWNSSDIAAGQTKTCETMLTIEVFDQDVNPPFAQGLKLLELLENQVDYRVVKRDGAKVRIATNDPNTVLEVIAQGPIRAKRVWANGKPVPVLDSRNRHVTSRTLYGSQFMHDLASLHAIVLDGFYVLVKEDPYGRDSDKPAQIATMIVSSKDPLSIEINLWPGFHLLPQSESRYKERTLASFSTNGVDYMSIEKSKRFVVLNYVLPYGYGNDGLTIELGESGSLAGVRDRFGHSYRLLRFYGIQDGVDVSF